LRNSVRMAVRSRGMVTGVPARAAIILPVPLSPAKRVELPDEQGWALWRGGSYHCGPGYLWLGRRRLGDVKDERDLTRARPDVAHVEKYETAAAGQEAVEGRGRTALPAATWRTSSGPAASR